MKLPLSLVALVISCSFALAAAGTCPEEPPVFNFTGPGEVVCPCFVEGEEAGVVLTPPAGTVYPIEVIRIGITWGSQFGGAPTSLEQALHVYEGGLPDPGTPVQTLAGPQFTDGFINEFDLEAFASTAIINAAPFSVSLQFLNDNAGSFFAPSVVHDGNGCQAGKNLVKAIPGGWADACALGVTGDWVMYAVYRPVNCATDAPEELLVASAPTALLAPSPNPVESETRIDFFVAEERHVELSVFDVQGRRVAPLVNRTYTRGGHSTTWDARDAAGRRLPGGVYFVVMESDGRRHSQKVVLAR